MLTKSSWIATFIILLSIVSLSIYTSQLMIRRTDTWSISRWHLDCSQDRSNQGVCAQAGVAHICADVVLVLMRRRRSNYHFIGYKSGMSFLRLRRF